MTEPSEWFTAAELAAAALPGIPSTKRGVRYMAERSRWENRRRAGRGGGWEYPLSALPAEARAELARRRASDAARAGRLEARKLAVADNIAARSRELQAAENLKALGQVNGWQGAYLDASLAILAALRAYHHAAGGTLQLARHRFAAEYNAGGVDIDPAHRARIPTLSAATLQRWEGRVSRHGLAGIARRYGNRKGKNAIDADPAIRDLVVGLLVDRPHCSNRHIEQAIRAAFPRASISLRTIQRYTDSWKAANKQVYTAATNPDAWKGRHMAAFGSMSEGVERLNQLWELDSTPGDVMLADGRHMVLGVVDVYSGRARLLVARTSKSAAIATLLRHALLDWGVPEVCKTDNGQDYVSRHLQRVFAELAIEHQLCPPFQPWHKPHVERFFRTFSHGLVELLAGFVGHNVAERKAIEARRSFADRLLKRDQVAELPLTAAEFQRFCDDWCANVHEHTPSKGLDGRTPFEVAAAWRAPVRTITDPRALDVLLAEPAGGGRRTVQKKGLRLDETWFIAPELAMHIGEAVDVREDPVELGRIYVFGQDGRFLCVAEAPERTGMDRREVAARARELQKARVQDERRALKAAGRRAGTDRIVETILADRAEKAGKLARLPARDIAHASDGLTQALNAARALEAPRAASLPDHLQAIEARITAELEAPPENVVAIEDTPDARYRRWLRLHARIDAGENVAGVDRTFYTGYGASDEWRAMRRLAEDFGLDEATG